MPHALSPAALADALRQPGTVLLDGPRPDADTGVGGALLFRSPVRTVVAHAAREVGPALDALDAALAEGRHVAGALAYEAGFALDPAVFPDPPEARGPLVQFGVYEQPEALSADAVDAALATAGPFAVRAPQFAWTREAYRERIARVHGHIRAGDVYQLNLTAPVRFGFEGDPLGLFAALRRRQRVAYGAVLSLGGGTALSLSPELFFRVDPDEGGRRITARPMKGTAARGATRADDDRLVDALLAREKDRAENLMIVDLLRNDLARVCDGGSVRVPRLFEAERYETLTQMTSTVMGRLRPDVGLADAVRALFPCGSVTGAPKLRAMARLRDLEAGPRGVYCGAIGHAAPAEGGLGRATFNVAIRTAVVEGGEGRYGVGSGVVWDSEADAEYDECRLKARVLTGLAS